MQRPQNPFTRLVTMGSQETAMLFLLCICGGIVSAEELQHLDPESNEESTIFYRENKPSVGEPYNETLRRYITFSNETLLGNLNSYRLVLAYFIEYIKGAEADVVNESPDLQSYQDVYMYDKADRREIINYHSQNFRENLFYNTEGDNPWGNSPDEDGVAVIQSSDYGTKPKPKPATVTVNMTALVKVPKEVMLLDQNTANPMLSVSKDGTSVKQGVLQNLPETPERFNSLPCVLATKGISSGKHYWEVQILDEQCEDCNPSIWIMGVAKKSVKRKGKVYATSDEGLWVLQWINFYQGGLSVPFDVMNLKTKPSLLGLFLDYEMGSLTFYNAANGKVLYTIIDKFNEQVFPIFCTTNSVELKL